MTTHLEISEILRHAVPLRSRVPYRERKRDGGAVRAAALLAADDAADRLLVTMHVANDSDYFDDLYSRDEWEVKVADIAQELCDFAALAEESADDLLREGARIYLNDPEYTTTLVDGLALLGRISGQRRAA